MAGWLLRVVSVAGIALASVAGSTQGAVASTSDIVRLTDLPSGWQTAPVLPSDSVAPATAACAALGAQQRTSIVTVGTPKFVDPRASSALDVVAATVTTMPSAQAAKQQVTALLSRRLLQCLIDAANARFTANGTDATTVVRRIHIPHADARVQAVRGTTTVSGPHRFRFIQDVVFVQVGNHIATLHVETDDHADYTALRNRLVPIVERRLRAAGTTAA